MAETRLDIATLSILGKHIGKWINTKDKSDHTSYKEENDD